MTLDEPNTASGPRPAPTAERDPRRRPSGWSSTGLQRLQLRRRRRRARHHQGRLHYHFASKAELGQALIARYAERFARLARGDRRRRRSPPASSPAYAGLYPRCSASERMCLCGMLAAEYRPSRSRCATPSSRFFERTKPGLPGSSTPAGATARSGSRATREVAQTTISTLEGALLVSRPYGGVEPFRDDGEETARRYGRRAGLVDVPTQVVNA